MAFSCGWQEQSELVWDLRKLGDVSRAPSHGWRVHCLNLLPATLPDFVDKNMTFGKIEFTDYCQKK